MPMTGATLDSASLDASKTIVSWVGTNLGETQYAVCAARVLLGATWTSLTITAWSGLAGTGAAVSALPAGTYTLEVTTSDSAVLMLVGAFVVAGGSTRRQSLSLSIGISI